jgi:hypothetical protein
VRNRTFRVAPFSASSILGSQTKDVCSPIAALFDSMLDNQ